MTDLAAQLAEAQALVRRQDERIEGLLKLLDRPVMSHCAREALDEVRIHELRNARR